MADSEFPLQEVLDSALGDDPLNPNALRTFVESLRRTEQLLLEQKRDILNASASSDAANAELQSLQRDIRAVRAEYEAASKAVRGDHKQLQATLQKQVARLSSNIAFVERTEQYLTAVADADRLTVSARQEIEARPATACGVYLQLVELYRRVCDMCLTYEEADAEAEALAEAEAERQQQAGEGKAAAAAGEEEQGADEQDSKAAKPAGRNAVLPTRTAPTAAAAAQSQPPAADSVERYREGCFQLRFLLRGRVLTLGAALRTKATPLLEAALKALDWPQPQRKQLKVDDAAIAGFVDSFGSLVLLQTAMESVQRDEDELTPGKVSEAPETGDEPATTESPSAATAPLSAASPSPRAASTDTKDSRAAAANVPPEAKQYTPLWALDMLLVPLVKRFHYHFSGNRVVQGVIEQCELPKFDVKLEFAQALLSVVCARLDSEVPNLLSKPSYFRHLVDEALSFEAKLRSHGYPANRVSCLPVFTKEPVFGAWLKVDKDFVNTRLEGTLRAMADPWLPAAGESKPNARNASAATGGGSATDDEKEEAEEAASQDAEDVVVTRSASELVALLDAVTDRYRLLTNNDLRLRFVHDIQFKLMRIYIEDVESDFKLIFKYMGNWRIADNPSSKSEHVEVSRGVQQVPHRVWAVFCGLVNTLDYCEAVLQDWGNQALFIELWQHEQARRRKAGGGHAASPPAALTADSHSQASAAPATNTLARNSSESKAGNAGATGSLAAMLSLGPSPTSAGSDGKRSGSPKPAVHRSLSLDRLSVGEPGTNAASPAEPLGERDVKTLPGVGEGLFAMLALECKASKTVMLERLADVMHDSFMRLTIDYKRMGHMSSVGRLGIDEVPDSFDVSPSLCDALATLKCQLIVSGRALSRPLHRQLWASLAAKLNTYIYEHLIHHNYFSGAGAGQFVHDMSALFLVFKAYTSAPQNYFKQVKEALILLRLPAATLQTLRTQLESSSDVHGKHLLVKHGVRVLSPENALDIIAKIRTS